MTGSMPCAACTAQALRRRDAGDRDAVAGRAAATARFVAKFLIFRNVLAAGYTTFAVAGLVASYLGIYFYLRVIQYMFMSTDVQETHGRSRRLALRGEPALSRTRDRADLLPGLVAEHAVAVRMARFALAGRIGARCSRPMQHSWLQRVTSMTRLRVSSA
jgi:hypothetical protein